jgi:hypothetical protein
MYFAFSLAPVSELERQGNCERQRIKRGCTTLCPLKILKGDTQCASDERGARVMRKRSEMFF